jgi:CheY-like chemotaxis protein
MADAAHSAGEITSPRQPPYRLLVVDDEEAIRELTSTVLADDGYEILMAEDGVHALELLPRFRPDLVITDLQMPRMSGIELVKIMRQRFPHLPVIILSGAFAGNELPPDVVADAFLPKDGGYVTTLGYKIAELLSGTRPSAVIAAV